MPARRQNRRLVRFAVGEGVEKRADEFAARSAAMTGKSGKPPKAWREWRGRTPRHLLYAFSWFFGLTLRAALFYDSRRMSLAKTAQPIGCSTSALLNSSGEALWARPIWHRHQRLRADAQEGLDAAAAA